MNSTLVNGTLAFHHLKIATVMAKDYEKKLMSNLEFLRMINDAEKKSHVLCMIFFPYIILTHCGRVTQTCVFNTVKLGTSASSP